MSISILATKLCTPLLRPNLVPRPRLVKRLNDGLWQPGGFFRRLTILSAPAGYGKTTLAVEWLRSSAHPFSWIALDAGDNDPARFLAYLVEALKQVEPGFGRTVEDLMKSPQVPTQAVLTALVNEINGLAHSVILVLDDYHQIVNPVVHGQLNFLLDNQPANLHLVIASREDPPVPVTRLRAQNQIAEIRQTDLKFTLDEIRTFLWEGQGVELALEDLRDLASRVEGWAVGLQLVALSMQGVDDLSVYVRSFTGSNRYILDYLFEEVLARQPGWMQDFLLHTSTLNRLSAPLCNAITSREDGQAILEQLEKDNLFIVRLDPCNDWYRYHPLFLELLRHQLRLAQDQSVPALHLKASDWFEQNGFLDDAVEHALSAEAWDKAAMLIHRASTAKQKHGEFATLINWCRRLPDSVMQASPPLCVDYAWPLLMVGQLDPAGALLAQAETLAGEEPLLMGEIATAQAYLAQMRGDGPGLVHYSERALALLPESNKLARSLVALNLGIAYWHIGKLEDAERALDASLRAAEETGNVYAVSTALIFQARCQAVRGQLRQAEVKYRQVVKRYLPFSILALAYFDLGALFYEWNDLPKAEESIQRGLGFDPHSSNLEFHIAGLMMLSRLRLSQGNLEGALKAVQQASEIDRSGHAPGRTGSRLNALQVELALSLRDLEGAARYGQELPDDVDVHPFYRFLGLTKARLLIASGATAQAAQLLETSFTRATQAGWGYGAIATRVLQALAADTPTVGVPFLVEALNLAQPEGYLRSFADAGDALIPFLLLAGHQGADREYTEKILAVIGYRPGMSRPSLPPGMETLSERELEVLRLAETGLSNPEIGKRLHISPGTAKTHIHHICGKLEVRNRTEAVTRARELGLI